MLNRLGKYELLEEVGGGAMGQVYKALDPSIRRLVALKTIKSSLVGDPGLLERFHQEARSAGTLQHSNIVTIYELGIENDTPFIAMEFLAGESLEKIIERRPVLPLSQKVGLILQVCRAIDYAHKRGVVHRDIKPGNVMLTEEGVVKVVDFGIARLADGSKTQTNLIIGTLGYMSPEQFRGERADQRSDIWSLGVLFYELLTYQRPFDGENQPALIFNIVDDQKLPPPLIDRVPKCPPPLVALVNNMLQKDVSQRFQTVEEVLFAIEPIWKNLLRENIEESLAESEALIKVQDFARAREVLRGILQADSSNERAKSLLESVNAELRLIQIRAQVKNSLDRARNLLKDDHLREAQWEVEAALKLDPAFAPAIELLTEIRQAQEVQELLQTAKQQLAEGALTEAEQTVQKVLDRDSSNPQACLLQQQVREQIARRIQRERLAGILQRARKHWAEQQLEECIALLTDSEKEFPGEPEIKKLLQTAKSDLAERQKQQKVAAIRGLLAEQRLDDALASVEALFREHPGDSSIRKLRELVIREREDLLRQRRLAEEIANLKLLLNAERFSEVVSKGEKLLREFPQETSRESEIPQLINFARSELAKLEYQRNLAEALQNVRKKLAAAKFQDAVAAIQKAQIRFPDNSDLQSLLDEARAKLKEQEIREQFQQRISQIRKKINKGQYTEAVDLAHDTLSTLGHETQVIQLLRAAEMELAQKRAQKEEQDKQVAAAQKLVHDGQLDGATQIIQSAVETQILSKKDPRIREILQEIREKKTLATRNEPPALLELPANSGEPANEYIFQQGAPLQPSRTGILSKDSNRSASLSVASYASSSASGWQSAEASSVSDWTQDEATTSKNTFFLRLDLPQVRRTMQNWSDELIQICRRQIVLVIASGVTLAVVIAGAYYFLSYRSTKKVETALLAGAQQSEQKKNWPDALKQYQILASRNGLLSKEAHQNAARLTDLLEQENSFEKKAKEAEKNGDLAKAKDAYQAVVNLHGDEEQEALSAASKLLPVIVDPPPSPQTQKKQKGREDHHSLPAAAAPQPVPNEYGECQVPSGDIPRRLSRADRHRAEGNYAEAKREYRSILACDQSNVYALVGLNKTKEAEAVIH